MESSQKVVGARNVWNAKSCLAKERVKRKFINKKMQTISAFSKFWKEFINKHYIKKEQYFLEK